MGMPADNVLCDAVVEFLAKRGGVASGVEVVEGLAKKFRLSAADLELRVSHPSRPNGESAWKHRLRRVKFTLRKQGHLASSSGERGVWRLNRRVLADIDA